MKSVLIIGRHGQVSTYLQNTLEGDYTVIVAGRDRLDLSHLDEIQTTLKQINPTVIINPAAYTAVDLAEQEQQQAFTINRDAVEQIADYSARTQTPLIHFSTDYVFDGRATKPYTETDPTGPTGVYGRSKLEGELAVLRSGAPAIVLRTSWVYSNHGKNFYKTMLMLAQSRQEVSVVADQVGAPTYAGSIAGVCKQLVDIVLAQGRIEASQAGVYHFSCQGETSWAEFAKAIFIANHLDKMIVHPISTEQYPTPAKRPAFSVLSTQKLHTVFNLCLPDWQDALAACAIDTRDQGK